MSKDTRLQEISRFLKTKRSEIKPDMIGLKSSGRRKIPGLRREEVAALANISTNWYTWLEQGRDINISPSVIESISKALMLNLAEKKYFYSLLNNEVVFHTPNYFNENVRITPSLQTILDQLDSFPIIVSDRRRFVVGWNQLSEKIFMDFGNLPNEERNLLDYIMSENFKKILDNWNETVKIYLSIFKTYYGEFIYDTWYENYIGFLENKYPEFQKLWHESEVAGPSETPLKIKHKNLGNLHFNLNSIQVLGQDNLRVSIYTPIEGTETESKLKIIRN